MTLYQVERKVGEAWVACDLPEQWSSAQDRAWRLAAEHRGHTFRIVQLPDDPGADMYPRPVPMEGGAS